MRDEIFDRPSWDYSCELYERGYKLMAKANQIEDVYWKGRAIGQAQTYLEVANELFKIVWRKPEE